MLDKFTYFIDDKAVLARGGEAAVRVFLRWLDSISPSSLLLMLVLLFGFQGK